MVSYLCQCFLLLIFCLCSFDIGAHITLESLSVLKAQRISMSRIIAAYHFAHRQCHTLRTVQQLPLEVCLQYIVYLYGTHTIRLGDL